MLQCCNSCVTAQHSEFIAKIVNDAFHLDNNLNLHFLQAVEKHIIFIWLDPSFLLKSNHAQTDLVCNGPPMNIQ